MALTVYNKPKEFAPAYNQMIFTLSSTNYAQPNFRFIADIYLNDDLINYTRLTCVSNPSNNYGVFDIAGIVQNVLSKDETDNTSLAKVSQNTLAYYNVKFGEQYGSTNSITTYPNLTSSSGYCFNGIFSPNEFLTYQKNDYVLNDTNTNWLTDCPKIYTRVGEKLTAGFMVDESNEAFYIDVKSYSASGYQSENSQVNPFRVLTLRDYRVINVDISYDFWDALDPDLFYPDTIYYTVQIYGFNLQRIKSLTVYIDDLCTKYDPIRFKFMNKYGRYDYYTFTGAKTKNTEIKKNNYKQNQNVWSSTNYNYNTRSRGLTQYETILNDTITIQSDWITQAESIWLEQLVSSPDVYIYEGSNLVSVNITNTSYQTKYEASEQLFNLSVSFQYSQNRKRQRR